MVNFYVEYTLACKSDRDSFLKEVLENKIIETSAAEDGNIRYEYYFPVTSDSKIFIFERWESLAHQQEHSRKPHLAVLASIKEKYDVKTEIRVEDYST